MYKIEEIFRVQTIKRWAIIEMSKDQSVAEHTYNVMMIMRRLGELLDRPITSEMYEYAMGHDAAETATGDIPTPAKVFIGDALAEYERSTVSWLRRPSSDRDMALIKSADIIEGIYFCSRYCVDLRKEQVIKGMVDALMQQTEGDEDLRAAAAEVLDGWT